MECLGTRLFDRWILSAKLTTKKWQYKISMKCIFIYLFFNLTTFAFNALVYVTLNLLFGQFYPFILWLHMHAKGDAIQIVSLPACESARYNDKVARGGIPLLRSSRRGTRAWTSLCPPLRASEPVWQRTTRTKEKRKEKKTPPMMCSSHRISHRSS